MSDTPVGHASDTAVLDEESAVRALVRVVEDYVTERRRPGGGYNLPEGLVLEMHPGVRRLIMLRGSAYDFAAFTAPDSQLRALIPVKVNPDLPPGTWRLAVVTTEVITGGRMPGA